LILNLVRGQTAGNLHNPYRTAAAGTLHKDSRAQEIRLAICTTLSGLCERVVRALLADLIDGVATASLCWLDLPTLLGAVEG